jgi:hypothetical protein
MQSRRVGNIVRLQTHPDGIGAIDISLCAGRHEIVTAGRDPALGFIGSDPWDTATYTGLIVPSATSASIGGARYMFMLARERFQDGEQGVKLVGIRQYLDLVATITPEGGSVQTYHKEIRRPMFHPPDGNVTFHVMVIANTFRDTRNPLNADSFIYQDSKTPALLYQTTAPYVPPNGGQPWGKPIGASLGNIHDIRYPWHQSNPEVMLDIPIPVPCDVALFASVRQNDPSTNPVASALTAGQIASLDPEEQFLVNFAATAQYGRIAGSLIFEENLP